jgi:CheY-like chemotaxis protein
VVLDARPGEIAMIFTDIGLSGRMDGVDLARVVSARTPNVPVILTSGESGERLRDLPETTEYMQKPWRALDLLIRAERVRAGGLAWRGDIL